MLPTKSLLRAGFVLSPEAKLVPKSSSGFLFLGAVEGYDWVSGPPVGRVCFDIFGLCY